MEVAVRPLVQRLVLLVVVDVRAVERHAQENVGLTALVGVQVVQVVVVLIAHLRAQQIVKLVAVQDVHLVAQLVVLIRVYLLVRVIVQILVILNVLEPVLVVQYQ